MTSFVLDKNIINTPTRSLVFNSNIKHDTIPIDSFNVSSGISVNKENEILPTI